MFTNWWMDNKLWYFHTMEYYPATKRSDILIHATIWINLENMLRGISHRRTHIVWFHLYEMSRIGNYRDRLVVVNRLVVAKVWVLGEWGVTASRYGVSFWDNEMFWNQTVVTVARPCECTKLHWLVNFGRGNCMVCELHLNKKFFWFKKEKVVSLVAQWLRIHLPMQGTWVQALVQEDPTCRRATKPVHHNYWACTPQPVSHDYWACGPQLLSPRATTTEACAPRTHAPQQEKPPQQEARAPQRIVASAHHN